MREAFAIFWCNYRLSAAQSDSILKPFSARNGLEMLRSRSTHVVGSIRRQPSEFLLHPRKVYDITHTCCYTAKYLI